jgi:hypothetical protein
MAGSSVKIEQAMPAATRSGSGWAGQASRAVSRARCRRQTRRKRAYRWSPRLLALAGLAKHQADHARETALVKQTVRRFYRAATVDELLAKVKDGRRSVLDE